MKLKTRLMVAFLTVTVVPMLLIFMAFMGLSSYQTGEIRKNYGLTEPVDILPANSMQIFSRLTESSQEEIREMIDEDPGAFEDRDYLDQLNEETLGKYAYTIVRKGEQIIYEGNPQDSREISPVRAIIISALPAFSISWGWMVLLRSLFRKREFSKDSGNKKKKP